MIAEAIAVMEPDPIPAIAIARIVTIVGIVNRFFSDRNDQMDTRLDWQTFVSKITFCRKSIQYFIKIIPFKILVD